MLPGTPLAAVFIRQGEGGVPAVVTDPSSTKNDPGLLPESSPPLDDDVNNSSARTAVEKGVACGGLNAITREDTPTTTEADAEVASCSRGTRTSA